MRSRWLGDVYQGRINDIGRKRGQLSVGAVVGLDAIKDPWVHLHPDDLGTTVRRRLKKANPLHLPIGSEKSIIKLSLLHI